MLPEDLDDASSRSSVPKLGYMYPKGYAKWFRGFLEVSNTLVNRVKIRKAVLDHLKDVWEKDSDEDFPTDVASLARLESDDRHSLHPTCTKVSDSEPEYSTDSSDTEEKLFRCGLPQQPCAFFIDRQEWQRNAKHYKLAMHTFGLLACSSRLKDFDEVLLSMTVVFCSPYTGKNIEKHLETLHVLMEKRGTLEMDDEEIVPEDYKIRARCGRTTGYDLWIAHQRSQWWIQCRLGII
ncbi:unnamed protein product [Pleuronectes platessa]|uniref:Uncharacterized protein n=1 Tax=Pleuronectes platessa TaxID=8262 RepID=A0A9N7Y513_PLEPL|nr:unnamed protein product [Pleuronectes platessa]